MVLGAWSMGLAPKLVSATKLHLEFPYSKTLHLFWENDLYY